MGDSPYACSGPSWDQARNYFLKNLNIEIDQTVIECVDHYMKTHGDRSEKYPFGSDYGFYSLCDKALQEIQELITIVKNPPNPQCPSCNTVITSNMAEPVIICDNGCRTHYCSECVQEFYFNFGYFEYGHDPYCDFFS